jgi:outer membrane protein TolC
MQKSSLAALLLAASVAPAWAVELPVVGPLAPAEALKPEPAAPVEPAAPSAPSVPETLTLDQALRFALENNYSIRLARERLKEQEGLIVEVRAEALPNLSLDANYSRDDEEFSRANGSGGPGGGRGYQDWTVGVYVRQMIYSGGGVRAALDAAKTTREAAVLDIQAVVDDVLLEVRTRFADALLARERIEVREQGVNLLREQLQTVRNRFDAGGVSQFEVLTAEVALANAQPPLISARNGFRIAIDELRRVLGYRGGFGADLQKTPEFEGELEYRPASYDLAASIVAARSRRPEILRLERLQDARQAGITVARSDYLPEVYVSGGYEGRKLQSSNSFRDTVDGWTAGVQGSWAIFDGARTRGRVAQARAQLAQARLTLAEQTLAIEVEVRRALSSLQEAAELADAAAKVVGQAEEALRLADVRFRNGAATQLDVLQARVALTEAQLNRLEANYRHTVALATVRKAIGEANTPASAE